jgi:hypothetical protein
MPTSKKPRKKYRPRPVMLDPVQYALDSQKMLKDYSSWVLDWSLKNNLAFGAMLKGEATKADIDMMVSARAMIEALVVTLKGQDVDGTLARSACALIEIWDRFTKGKGSAMRAPEMQALRDLMSLHDELMPVVTVSQFEKALAYAKRETRAGVAARKEAR